MTETMLNTLVQDFIIKYDGGGCGCRSPKEDGCTEICLEQDSLIKALDAAIISKDSRGRLNSHQCRVGNPKLKMYSNKLIGEKYEDIKKCREFDSLYNVIESCKMGGIGELTTYDIAVRTANYLHHNMNYPLNILPDKVYLHAGTLEGAKTLFGRDKRIKRILHRSSFPPPISNSKLSCDEIETFLCIYRDQIGKYTGQW